MPVYWWEHIPPHQGLEDQFVPASSQTGLPGSFHEAQAVHWLNRLSCKIAPPFRPCMPLPLRLWPSESCRYGKLSITAIIERIWLWKEIRVPHLNNNEGTLISFHNNLAQLMNCKDSLATEGYLCSPPMQVHLELLLGDMQLLRLFFLALYQISNTSPL